MSPAGRVVRIVHSCLDPEPRALPLVAARLTDPQRIAVLLQGAGLLAVLDRAGWILPDWSAARIARESLLSFPDGGVPGRSARQPQEILRDLLGRLFRYQGTAAFTGKGPARRAARALLDRWQQTLAPLTPDEAVAQILDEAPFLWEDGFAEVRTALAGELWWSDEDRKDRGVLWVAGPRPFRRRLLNRCRSVGDLRAVLAGPGVRAVWEGEEDEGDPHELAAARKWRAVVAVWGRRPPGSEGDRVELAVALSALGRSEAALAALDGLGSADAEVVRARCQLQLGRLGAVRATLHRVRKSGLNARQAAELAEIASRVLANAGRAERAGPWIDKALELGEAAGGPAFLRAGLVAAAASWDRRDLDGMDRWLDETRGALAEPDLAWRWHAVRALRSDREAVEHAARALRLGRRRLTRHEAAGLWNELGVGRARLGDLPGSERAFLHAVRLLEPCDGPRRLTLALPNLAEIRLRRGRLVGVSEIIERTALENRIARNVRGLAQDLGLQARLELVLGRPEAALVLCREAMELGWDEEVSRLLAARALGWLRRPYEAAVELAQVPPEALESLEPEERPALRALAGDAAGALKEAEGSPFLPLWRGALAGESLPLPAWEPLAALEPYRAARLVLDLELTVAGCVPAARLRSAAAVLRRLGSLGPAERLEARDQGPWQALAAYLEKPAGDPEALALLFDHAGYPGLVPGGEPLEAPARALLALAARDSVRRPEEPPEPKETPAIAAIAGIAAGEIAGESPPLLAALERLARLAPGDLPVLILGESGTGKELVARRLHRLSRRARSPFVAVNCAALSETLVHSDLFGHTRGSFTGAERSQAGVFESAHGGTVFLDEIGDLPLTAQGLLLRVLQEGEVRPVGEARPRKVDVRIAAATHRNLAEMVGEKTFREDLYFRLRGASVTLPPLRDRGKDVLLLAERFLRRLDPVPRLSSEARACLLNHTWPGNVRELQNVLGLAAALAGDGPIEPGHLELPDGAASPEAHYHQELEGQRRRMLLEAIARHGRNRTRIGRELGLSRQAVAYLLKRLKID